MLNWRPIVIAFVAGGFLKALEERQRREQLKLALTARFNAEESARLEKILSERPASDQYVLKVLLLFAPGRAMRRMRRLYTDDQLFRDANKGQ